MFENNFKNTSNQIIQVDLDNLLQKGFVQMSNPTVFKQEFKAALQKGQVNPFLNLSDQMKEFYNQNSFFMFNLIKENVSPESILIKAYPNKIFAKGGLPPGTTRVWGDGRTYVKQSSGRWTYQGTVSKKQPQGQVTNSKVSKVLAEINKLGNELKKLEREFGEFSEHDSVIAEQANNKLSRKRKQLNAFKDTIRKDTLTSRGIKLSKKQKDFIKSSDVGEKAVEWLETHNLFENKPSGIKDIPYHAMRYALQNSNSNKPIFRHNVTTVLSIMEKFKVSKLKSK